MPVRTYRSKDLTSDYTVWEFCKPQSAKGVVALRSVPDTFKVGMALVMVAIRLSCVLALPNKLLKRGDSEFCRVAVEARWLSGGILDTIKGWAPATRHNIRCAMVGSTITLAKTATPERENNSPEEYTFGTFRSLSPSHEWTAAGNYFTRGAIITLHDVKEKGTHEGFWVVLSIYRRGVNGTSQYKQAKLVMVQGVVASPTTPEVVLHIFPVTVLQEGTERSISLDGEGERGFTRVTIAKGKLGVQAKKHFFSEI
eukprot:Cvel_25952.t2-p1 / transcript=Cvel_25952.t2 / gene=Cvel_25952 / organism=Chromera_velia_CCMP2878 / gene_product=hypothetical protein / transcript_product=hypothetical protein / location=Cvel_scaffold3007:17450-18302(+) / protein_length=254 / sequence_SO=supercontig / SO=protein_coding / is_pseudo=false